MRYITFDESRPYDLILLGRIAIDSNLLDYYKTLAENETYRKYVGGPPANVAVGMSRFGMKCGFFIRVSDDRSGELATEFFEKEGIDTSHIRKCGNGESLGPTFTEILSHDESNILMYRNGIADLSLLPGDTDEEYVSQVKVVLISDMALVTNPSREVVLKTVALAKKRGAKVIFDVDYRACNWKNEDEIAIHYPAVARDSDIILGSKEEYDLTEQLLGLDGTDKTLAKYWCGQQASIVVVKRGKQGPTAYTKDGKSCSIKSFLVDALKGSGDGDGYASSFPYGVYKGLEMTDCLELGSVSVSMLVASHGCSPDMPVLEELQASMKKEKETCGEMVTRVEQSGRMGRGLRHEVRKHWDVSEQRVKEQPGSRVEREDRMEKRMIGKSGLKPSALALGCWAIGGGEWWGDNDDKMSIDIIFRGMELRISWIDTACVYGFRYSEEVVGKALKAAGRHNLLVSTKCGIRWYDDGGELHFTKEGYEVRRDLSPKVIRCDLELNLKTLQMDYIDIYYTHWQCMTYGLVSVKETMGELLKMKQGGKIRVIGAFNMNPQVMRDCVAAGQPDVVQEKPSIPDRKPEAELLPFCGEHGITLQTYLPIEQGLLVGRAPDDCVPQKGEARDGKVWWKPENIRRINRVLAGRKDLTEKYNCALANLCIRWNSTLSPNINAFCGARRLSQIEDVARSMDVPLSREDFLRMKMDADEAIAEQV